MAALESNILKMKLENLLEQTFIEYKHMIQLCVDTCEFIDFMLKGKSLLDYTNVFLLVNVKRMTK